MKNLLRILFGLFSTKIALAALASPITYDQISITAQTWAEIDLTYINIIDGEKYTEHANLLRPVSWIRHNHLDKIGSIAHLTKAQLGIEADVTIAAINLTKLNYKNNRQENFKPVIATFITHSKDVGEYTLGDQYGHREKIRTVSSHLFYVPRLNSYVPIGQIKSGERLKGSNGINITLIQKRPLNQVESVYNFEVYQKHNYKVGNSSIVVHNPGCDEPLDLEITNQQNMAAREAFIDVSLQLRSEKYITALKNGSSVVFNPDTNRVAVAYNPNILIGGEISPLLETIIKADTGAMRGAPIGEVSIKMIAVANAMDDLNYFPFLPPVKPVGIKEFLNFRSLTEFAKKFGYTGKKRFQFSKRLHHKYIKSRWGDPPENGIFHLPFDLPVAMVAETEVDHQQNFLRWIGGASYNPD